MGLMNKLFGSYSQKELKKIEPIKQQVLDLEKVYSEMSEETLKGQTQVLKARLAGGETLDDILPDAFAVIRETSFRVLKMKHFPVQIVGGIALHQGRIAEMRTGEGKTLVGTLPTYLNALTGKGVHLVTVNEYLAKRDSEWMGKIYSYLGLTVGLNVNGMSSEQKREAYACDITYGTNNEYGFDYLRDNMVIYKSQKVQRGHFFAVVDEVDSILIDEARTPLIISGRGDKSTELYAVANKFASQLTHTKFREVDSKEDNDSAVTVDYIVDEKAKSATLTKHGVNKVEQYFNIENLMDSDNLTLQHHINQAIKAQATMIRDINYVVNNGEIVIVDEFTGRMMNGRRYSDGLHQAIEAKEGVKIENESKTFATITFQNYFRLYHKLSGMTGTAETEENEFREIYSLDVLVIPTNNVIKRIDHNDIIYKTEEAKFKATVNQIIECNQKQQPVLVGTVSIDKSEYLSNILKKHGIKHNVLNAKHHEKEAEIIAQAGKIGAITIATNMAGRGTDIVLGGNSDYHAKTKLIQKGYDDALISQCDAHGYTEDPEILAIREEYDEIVSELKKDSSVEAQKVKDIGGLFIIGTERHESRRIDNQLRGRAGRQGDPGETIFFLSLEDDLMRLFGGEKIQNLMEKMNVEEDMPIEMGLITKQIEGAQRKIEGRNFSIRKNVLGFDDVMNTQRQTIYKQRAKVLDGENIKDNIISMVKSSIVENTKVYVNESVDRDDWNLNGLRDHYAGLLTNDQDFRYAVDEIDDVSADDIVNTLTERALALYSEKEESTSPETMREIERVILLREVDKKWVNHIDSMEELKKGIYLRSYGQRDPIVEYRLEGFDMFDEMIASIQEDTVKNVLTVKIQTSEPIEREEVIDTKNIQMQGNEEVTNQSKKPTSSNKVGPNEPCPCGSGKKHKKCCG